MSATEQDTQQQLAEVPRTAARASTGSVFNSIAAFEDAQRMANCLAACDLVPAQYVNNKANCTIAIEMAQRMGASPLAVMQNLHIIHGRPSWSAVFIIASLNTSGKFSPLRYEFGRDDKGVINSCYAWAKDLNDGERLEGPTVTWTMAVAEGWVEKKGSKWKTMADIMFMYRAASFFGKMFAPENLMGMSSAEEMNDIIDLTPNSQGDFVMPATKGNEGVKDKLKANATHPSEAHVVVDDDVVDTQTGEVMPKETSAETANDRLKDTLKNKAKGKTSNAKNADVDQF